MKMIRSINRGLIITKRFEKKDKSKNNDKRNIRLNENENEETFFFVFSDKARRLWEEREAMVMQKIKMREEKRVELSKESNLIHNPFAPSEKFVRPTIERPRCSFFMKTGVCRYNER